MKINLCPVCHRKAFSKLNQIFVEQAFITCQNCGAHVNHRIPHLIAPNIVALIALSFSLEFLREMKELWVYLYFVILALLWVAGVLFFVPLREVASPELEQDLPKQSGGNHSLKWFHTPFIWLGIPVALAVLYGLLT